MHWLAWNIPASTTSLQEGLQEQPRLPEPDGAAAGPHHYHFQVYALDATLDLPWGAERDTLLDAMKGHVLAKGELLGTYAQKQKPQK